MGIRNTRLWQDSLAHATVFDGDPSQCSLWLGWAKTKLSHMLHSVPGPLSATFVPVEGIEIRVDTRPNRIAIKAGGGLYLESGFLALGSTASCAEATFYPPILHFNSPIQNYVSASSTPLEGKAKVDAKNTAVDSPYAGEKLLDGYTSKTSGGAELYPLVYDLCGNAYASETDKYGLQDMYAAKYAQRYVPASVYSGKLRLLVQAIYGSTRHDYYAVPISNGNAYICDLVFDEYRLIQNTPTAGLLTTTNYDYYLVEVNHDAVTFRKLTLSATAKGWAKILKTHPNKANREFSSRVEAYILSTAKIDTEFVPVIKETGLAITGVPMAYGFHFNWSGNQAKCVFHRSVGDGTYRSKIVTIDIADDLTVSASESSESAWSNGAYFQFWYPDQYDNTMKTFGVVNGGYVNSTGTPMYGYFDYNDAWQTFDISCSISTRAAGRYDTGAITNSDLTGYGFDAIEHTRTIITATATQNIGSIGYSLAGESFSGTVMSACTKEYCSDATAYDNTSYQSSQTTLVRPGALMREGYLDAFLWSNYPSGYKHFGWRTDGAFPPGTRLTLDVAIGSPLPTSADTWTTYRQKPDGGGILYNSYTRYQGYADVSEIMMGIAFSDCESLIFGSFSGAGWTQKDTSRANANVILRSLFTQEVVQTGLNPYGTSYSTNYTTVHDNKQQIASSSGGLGLGTLTTTYSDNATTAAIKFKASNHEGWTHITSDGSTIKSEAINTSAPSGWAEKYFRVADSFGDTYHPTMIARASANGAHILYHDEADSPNENGYPEGVYNSVGWA